MSDMATKPEYLRNISICTATECICYDECECMNDCPNEPLPGFIMYKLNSLPDKIIEWLKITIDYDKEPTIEFCNTWFVHDINCPHYLCKIINTFWYETRETVNFS